MNSTPAEVGGRRMQRRLSQLQTARACKVLGSDLQNHFGDEQVPTCYRAPVGTRWCQVSVVLER